MPTTFASGWFLTVVVWASTATKAAAGRLARAPAEHSKLIVSRRVDAKTVEAICHGSQTKNG
jgi:hypothetical protein